MKKVMIVAAHPDDAEISMGGTIIQMVEFGWDVTVVDLTDGEPTPFGTPAIRKEETAKANEIMGLAKRICLDMPNRSLQADLKNRKKIAEIIRISQPEILFAPFINDYHPDHIEATKLVETARFEAKYHKTDMKGSPHWVPEIYYYYSVHRQSYEKPSFIIDVTNQWDKKRLAVSAYQSQIKNILLGDLSLLEKIEIICRYFGYCINCKYGEPFFSNEPIRHTILNSERFF